MIWTMDRWFHNLNSSCPRNNRKYHWRSLNKPKMKLWSNTWSQSVLMTNGNEGEVELDTKDAGSRTLSPYVTPFGYSPDYSPLQSYQSCLPAAKSHTGHKTKKQARHYIHKVYEEHGGPIHYRWSMNRLKRSSHCFAFRCKVQLRCCRFWWWRY